MSRKAKIDRQTVEKLALLGMSMVEIAKFFDVSEKTIRNRFKTVVEQGKVKRYAALRQRMYQVATNPESHPQAQTTALIFLHKCEMGYRETQQLEVTGKDGGPIKTETKAKGGKFDYGAFEQIFNRMQAAHPAEGNRSGDPPAP